MNLDRWDLVVSLDQLDQLVAEGAVAFADHLALQVQVVSQVPQEDEECLAMMVQQDQKDNQETEVLLVPLVPRVKPEILVDQVRQVCKVLEVHQAAMVDEA